jgi:putative RecB family exonuclease
VLSAAAFSGGFAVRMVGVGGVCCAAVATPGTVLVMVSRPKVSPSPQELPSKLSPSRAKDFMQCPKKFYFQTILKLPHAPTVHTAVGTVAHTAFERIFDFPRGERNPEVALPLVRPAWEILVNPLKDRASVEPGSPEDRVRSEAKAYRDLVPEGSRKEQQLLATAEAYRNIAPDAEEEDALVARAEEMVHNWFTMENPSRFDPVGRELYLSAKILGVPLHGFIDRLDKVRFSDGYMRTVISDYKTGKIPQPRFLDEAFFAMRVYAVLYQEIYHIHVDQLRLVYVQVPGRDSVKTLTVTPQMLESTTGLLRSVWAKITRAARSNEWPTRTGPLCPWCDYQDICPAWHPELDGMLPEERNPELAASG